MKRFFITILHFLEKNPVGILPNTLGPRDTVVLLQKDVVGIIITHLCGVAVAWFGVSVAGSRCDDLIINITLKSVVLDAGWQRAGSLPGRSKNHRGQRKWRIGDRLAAIVQRKQIRVARIGRG